MQEEFQSASYPLHWRFVRRASFLFLSVLSVKSVESVVKDLFSDCLRKRRATLTVLYSFVGPSPMYFLIQANVSRCQISEFCGFRIQWFSSGKVNQSGVDAFLLERVVILQAVRHRHAEIAARHAGSASAF